MVVVVVVLVVLVVVVVAFSLRSRILVEDSMNHSPPTHHFFSSIL